MARPTWNEYFMTLAGAVAARGTCPRRQVGCVIVVDRRVIATGYNGSISGLPHCDEVGCEMVDGHCVRSVHGETNALAQAARYGTAVNGGTCYLTCSPCWSCFKLLANAGIKKIVFAGRYDDDRFREAARTADIELICMGELAGKVDKGTTAP